MNSNRHVSTTNNSKRNVNGMNSSRHVSTANNSKRNVFTLKINCKSNVDTKRNSARDDFRNYFKRNSKFKQHVDRTNNVDKRKNVKRNASKISTNMTNSVAKNSDRHEGGTSNGHDPKINSVTKNNTMDDDVRMNNRPTIDVLREPERDPHLTRRNRHRPRMTMTNRDRFARDRHPDSFNRHRNCSPPHLQGTTMTTTGTGGHRMS
jgi:hypothetical protein